MAIKTARSEGKKKKTTAQCLCRQTGKFELTINNVPLRQVEDKLTAAKLKEVITIIEPSNIADLSFAITVKSQGRSCFAYSVRQAFCRAVIAYFGMHYDEWKKQEIKSRLMSFDRFTLVSDPRRAEPKKFGGPGARARYQKSYR